MSSFIEKVSSLKAHFANCSDAQARYQKIILLGKELTKLTDPEKIESNRVHGCQSRMYLVSDCQDGKMKFRAESDALISCALAALLVIIYDGESPETVLKIAPDYLEELGIPNSISPSRANGLYSLHLKMKQDALQSLVSAKQ